MGLAVPSTPPSLSRLEPHPRCTHMEGNDCITWLPIEAVQHHTFDRCPASEMKLAGHLGCQTAGGVTNACWPFRRDVMVPETRVFALFSGWHRDIGTVGGNLVEPPGW